MKDDERIEKYCKYCELAKTLSDPDTMLCDKLGVVDASFCCRKFRYDALKRAPKRGIREVEDIEFVEV